MWYTGPSTRSLTTTHLQTARRPHRLHPLRYALHWIAGFIIGLGWTKVTWYFSGLFESSEPFTHDSSHGIIIPLVIFGDFVPLGTSVLALLTAFSVVAALLIPILLAWMFINRRSPTPPLASGFLTEALTIGLLAMVVELLPIFVRGL